MATVTRRIFLKASGAAALTPAAVDAAQQRAVVEPTAAAAGPAAEAPNYLFLNAPEAAFLEAAVVRLIPPDELGPSALEAAVPTYIDRQLHGAWGAGERFHRSGPWVAVASATQGLLGTAQGALTGGAQGPGGGGAGPGGGPGGSVTGESAVPSAPPAASR